MPVCRSLLCRSCSPGDGRSCCRGFVCRASSFRWSSWLAARSAHRRHSPARVSPSSGAPPAPDASTSPSQPPKRWPRPWLAEAGQSPNREARSKAVQVDQPNTTSPTPGSCFRVPAGSALATLDRASRLSLEMPLWPRGPPGWGLDARHPRAAGLETTSAWMGIRSVWMGIMCAHKPGFRDVFGALEGLPCPHAEGSGPQATGAGRRHCR